MNISWKKFAKTIGNSYFWLKNHQLWLCGGPLWTTPITKAKKCLKIVIETFCFLKKIQKISLSYACFCILSDFLHSEIRPFPALTALYRIFLLCFNHVHLLATLICFNIVDLNYNYNVGALIFGNVIVFTGMLMLMLTPSNNNSKQNKGFSPREFIGLLCQ